MRRLSWALSPLVLATFLACGGEPGTVDGAVDGGADDASADGAARDTAPPFVDAGPDECPDDPDKWLPGACGCGTSDHDGDLDGLPDCVDPHPRDPFADTEAGPAGSAAPLEVRARNFAAGGWDGRLYIGLRNQNVGGELVVTYAAELLRPEAITHDVVGRPVLDVPEIFAPRRVFENDDPAHGFHVAICPDPAFPENPFPSDAAGAPDPNGDHRAYRVGFIGVGTRPADQFLTVNRGLVVVANPETVDASIVVARMDGTMSPLTTVSGARLNHYEPSITPDGRLIVWHGRVGNRPDRPSGVAVYSYNPTPLATAGWSEPRSITDMHYVHGPGAATETRVAGVPFSERYPVAREPMRDYDGRVFRPGEYMFGPYPWVSFDGSEIFFPVIPTFEGPSRSAVTAVGLRTGWALRHLDGAVNPSRSDVLSDGTNVVFASLHDEARLLQQAYNANTLGDGRPLGINGYQRLFVIPVALSQSMWTTMARRGEGPLPEDKRRGTYGFFLSHSSRYVEVDLGEIEDGHTLLHLPMNEHVAVDHTQKARSLSGTLTGQESWRVRRLATPWVVDRTPDASGALQHGRPTGASAFPFEHFDAQGTWQSFFERWQANNSLVPTADDIRGDRIHGIVGNAIFFGAGGAVTTTLAAATMTRLVAAEAISASLWVKPLVDAPTFSLMTGGSAFALRYDGGDVVAQVGAVTVRAPGRAVRGSWQHVAITAGSDVLRLWVDGQIATEAPLGALGVGAGDSTVVVGPADVTSPGGHLCLIDEVLLSDVLRTEGEIEREALVVRMPRAGAAVWDRALPAGLDPAQGRLPEGFGAPTDAMVALGERLFFDPILSRDRDVSCATCHDPELAFTDGLMRAMGVEEVERNSPVAFNRLFSTAQFFDGRAASLEAQALGPIADPREMGFDVPGALARLREDPSYRAEFTSAFGLEATDLGEAHLAGAIAAYERTLVSGAARVDSGHLTSSERRGRALFFGRARCAGCHVGPNFTDERFHGVGHDLTVSGNEGLMAITRRRADRGLFKTPTLRDVTRTAPYLHDGSLATLREVIEFYDKGGDSGDNRDFAIQPLGLTPENRVDLEAFLGTLEGTSLPAGPAMPAVPTPTLVGGGVPGGLWMLGLGFGDTPTVRFYGASGGALVETIVAADLNVGHGIAPPGWSGLYDRVTMTVTPAMNAALGAGGLEAELEAGGRVSARLPLNR